MASGDTGIKVLLVIVVVLLLAASQGEEAPPSASPSAPVTTVAPAPSPSATTNIPGGALTACTGDLLSTETVAVGEQGGLTLQVFYAEADGGRNCAMVSKTGTARELAGELTVTLQFHSYDGRRWPRYAEQSSRLRDRSDGIYLDETNDRCVRAWARFAPDRGRTATLTSGKVGCR